MELLATSVGTLAAGGIRYIRLQFPARRVAAYDKSMAAKPNGIRPMRWPLWLGAGMLFGLALGFAFGLAKPRVRK